MFSIVRPVKRPVTIIRQATAKELSEYEKWKLANSNKSANNSDTYNNK